MTQKDKAKEKSIEDLKKAEDSLAFQQLFLSAVLENLDAGVVACNKKGELILFNQAARNWHGLDPLKIPQTEWAGRYDLYLADGVTPMDMNTIPLSRAFRGEEINNVGMVIAAKGQPKRHVIVHANPIKGKDGQIMGAVAVMHDITDRNNIELALRENKERLDLALWSAEIGIWSLDVVENKRYFDNQTCRLLGIDPDKFTGAAEEFFAVVHPEDREKIKLNLKKTIEDKGQYESDYRVVYPDGSIHYITARGRCMQGDNGNPTMINGVIWDITERKRAEQLLYQSEERYHGIVDNIGIGVALISPEMEILSLNNQMKKWNPHIDLKDKHICYRSFNNPPREEICPYCPTVKTLKDGLVHEDITETPMNGQMFNYRIVSSPIKDKSGKIIAAIEMVEDTTERRKVEEALQNKTAILEAQLNSTIDGILIVDKQGKKIIQNQRTIELWKIPQNIVDNNDDETQVQHVKNMTKNPGRFVEKIIYLYGHPNETSQDEVELIDGRVFDRYSAPVLDKEGKNYGRIWIFRDITERKNLEEENQKRLHEMVIFYKASMGREERIIELKKEVENLKKKLGI